MRALVAGLVLVPGVALAQPVPFPSDPNAGTVPTDLDPGRSGTQNIPPPPKAQTPAPQPNVVVVSPDGKVTTTAPVAPEDKFYITGNGTPYTEPEVIHTGPTPELHVVRSGDTLWDICSYYFNDPFQWPKIWSYNPQITNPHWIYPGDLVRLLPRGVFASQLGVGEPEKPDKGPVDVVPPPSRTTESGLKQTAFVEKEDLEKSIAIEGSVDEKVLLGSGDAVYLSYPPGKPPQVGQRYSIYQPGNPVKIGQREVGAYVHILGTVQVDSVKQDKHARGTIVESNQEIERGAKVGPLMKTFKNVGFVAPKVDAQGNIVAMLTRDQLIGQGEVVFVDLGDKSGLEVGNRMYVVRRGDAKPDIMDREAGQDNRKFPARALGQIVIVEVGKNISIGLVTLSVQEMSVGDLVMMQKSK
jgi:hypothetical protein